MRHSVEIHDGKFSADESLKKQNDNQRLHENQEIEIIVVTPR